MDFIKQILIDNLKREQAIIGPNGWKNGGQTLICDLFNSFVDKITDQGLSSVTSCGFGKVGQVSYGAISL